MSFIEEIKEKAKQNLRTVVFPEGDERRTVQAAAILQKEGLVCTILLGKPGEILAAAEQNGADISGIALIDPVESPKLQEYTELLYELRKAKGLTREAAAQLAFDPMYFGMLMVRQEEVDGLVSGAVHTTGDMLRPALQLIKTKPGIDIVSSSFIMIFPDRNIGHNGVLVYADCVVVPDPTAKELAQIAVTAADTAKTLCGIDDPKVALLSFSTKGSAKHDNVTKVQEAVKIAQEKYPP